MYRQTVFLGAAIVVACGGDGPSVPGGVEQWRLGEVPTVILGADDTRPGHTLTTITGAMRLSENRFAVASSLDDEVRIFDQGGELVASVGGAGGGPESFGGLNGIARRTPSSFAVLAFNPGIKEFTFEGEYLSTTPMARLGMLEPCRVSKVRTPMLPNGRLVVQLETNHWPDGCGEQPRDVWEADAVMTLVDPKSGNRIDLGRFPATEFNGTQARVYGGMLVHAESLDRVFVAHTRGDSIAVFDHDGHRVGSIVVPFRSRPVPGAARRRSEKTWKDQWGGTQRHPYDYPDEFPRIGWMLADREGLLWVSEFPHTEEPFEPEVFTYPPMPERPTDVGLRWLVLKPDGEPVGQLETPRGLLPLEIGNDYLIGHRFGDYDVESVEVFVLYRGQGSA